jgi:nudix motif 8
VSIVSSFGSRLCKLGLTQGFIHPSTKWQSPISDPEAPLPSITLSSLTLSEPEVAHIFHLPLSYLTSPTRLHSYKFRGGVPYWAVDVSDLIPEGGVQTESVKFGEQDEVGSGKNSKLEVWGLTGWYLTLLMRVLEVYP